MRQLASVSACSLSWGSTVQAVVRNFGGAIELAELITELRCRLESRSAGLKVRRVLGVSSHQSLANMLAWQCAAMTASSSPKGRLGLGLAVGLAVVV